MFLTDGHHRPNERVLAAPGAGVISASAFRKRNSLPNDSSGTEGRPPSGISGSRPPCLGSNTKIFDSDEMFAQRVRLTCAPWVSHAYHIGITYIPHGYHMCTTCLGSNTKILSSDEMFAQRVNLKRSKREKSFVFTLNDCKLHLKTKTKTIFKIQWGKYNPTDH